MRSRSQHTLWTTRLSTSQHSFLQKNCCAACVTECLNTFTGASDAGSSVITVYLDLTNVFDGVSHRRPIKQIKSYGITDPALPWFTSYNSPRNQIVPLNDFISQTRAVTSGVIQGSVLGPCRFFCAQMRPSESSETLFLSYSPLTSKSFTPFGPKGLLSRKQRKT